MKPGAWLCTWLATELSTTATLAATGRETGIAGCDRVPAWTLRTVAIFPKVAALWEPRSGLEADGEAVRLPGCRTGDITLTRPLGRTMSSISTPADAFSKYYNRMRTRPL